jgi:hypothetical protein
MPSRKSAGGLQHDLYEPEPFRGGGVAACHVCHCFEGTLLTYCPGYSLNNDTQEAIYRGNVTDLAEWKRNRDALAAMAQKERWDG